jgi:hypothetical protein
MNQLNKAGMTGYGVGNTRFMVLILSNAVSYNLGSGGYGISGLEGGLKRYE